MSVNSSNPQTPVYYAFAIRDIKIGSFMLPFFQSSKAGAMRSFADLARDPQSPMSRHPEDFQLFEIGVYDPETALLTPLPTVDFLANATDFLNQ